ncbi:hypothetical protein [Bifidobacterium oedipodis]|uniref:Uncharacterized protein n=1 Tax=Bifidobacterium oedipodis TaxID=2675322 RepID=A0A7Y0HRC5_9BIFI|nr:hypothetical protein [Bifidobacterium sp. DSM 109957]NMM93900.1 hypothetical protein [Bifidobacterium sp. DSM 109957]
MDAGALVRDIRVDLRETLCEARLLAPRDEGSDWPRELRLKCRKGAISVEFGDGWVKSSTFYADCGGDSIVRVFDDVASLYALRNAARRLRETSPGWCGPKRTYAMQFERFSYLFWRLSGLRGYIEEDCGLVKAELDCRSLVNDIREVVSSRLAGDAGSAGLVEHVSVDTGDSDKDADHVRLSFGEDYIDALIYSTWPGREKPWQRYEGRFDDVITLFALREGVKRAAQEADEKCDFWEKMSSWPGLEYLPLKRAECLVYFFRQHIFGAVRNAFSMRAHLESFEHDVEVDCRAWRHDPANADIVARIDNDSENKERA